MKKLTTCLLCAGLLFSLSACSGSKVEDKALDALETSINKIAEMKTASYKASVDTETEDGEEVNLTISGGYLFDTANPSITGTVDMSSGGQAMDGFLELYLKDQVMYLNFPMFGMKEKSPSMDLTDAGVIPDIDEESFQLNKEELKPYLKKATLDGSTLTIELDTKKFNEIMKDSQATADSLLPTASETTYNKVLLEIEVKDGFATKVILDLDGEQKSGTTTEKIVGKITLEFSDINAKKPLNFPDLSGYVESK